LEHKDMQQDDLPVLRLIRTAVPLYRAFVGPPGRSPRPLAPEQRTPSRFPLPLFAAMFADRKRQPRDMDIHSQCEVSDA